LHLQLGDAIDGVGAIERLDLRADGDAVGLFARERRRPLLFGGALLLPLANRLAHRFARRLELLRELGVELLDVRLQFRPRQPHLGQRRRRGIRIGHRDEPLGAVQQRRRPLAIVGTHPRRRLGRRRTRRVLDQAETGAGAPGGDLVPRTLRNRGQPLSGAHPLERGHRRIGVLGFQGDRRDLVGVLQTRERAEPRCTVLRMTADRSERTGVLQQIDRGGANRR
jgi:hypothetical protein